MKKLLFFIAIAAVMALQSCESCEKDNGTNNAPTLLYNVTATAEGQVEFTWFNGGANVDGFAQVYQCNDSANNLLKEKGISLAKALNSNDASVSEAANKVNSFLNVTSTTGKYKLTLKGYVKYGSIVFEIDEVYPKEVPDSI